MAGSLIFIGMMLIILNVIALRKDKKSFKNAVRDSEKNITDIDIRIGELRREFSETILELQKQIIELKEKNNLNELENNTIEVNNISELEKFNYEKMNAGRLSIELDNLPVNNNNYLNYNGTYSSEYNESGEHNDSDEHNDAQKQSDNNVNENKNLDIKDEIIIDESPLDFDKSNAKIKEIKELLDKGVSVEEIAERLNIGKGEVLLIRGLYTK